MLLHYHLLNVDCNIPYTLLPRFLFSDWSLEMINNNGRKYVPFALRGFKFSTGSGSVMLIYTLGVSIQAFIPSSRSGQLSESHQYVYLVTDHNHLGASPDTR